MLGSCKIAHEQLLFCNSKVFFKINNRYNGPTQQKRQFLSARERLRQQKSAEFNAHIFDISQKSAQVILLFWLRFTYFVPFDTIKMENWSLLLMDDHGVGFNTVGEIVNND